MIDLPELGDALCRVLGNTCRMARTAKSYGWNAIGPGAHQIAICLKHQADEMLGAVDPLAEHILGLGFPAIFDYGDNVVAINPPTANDIPTLDVMLDEIAQGHAQSGLSVGAVIDVAYAIQEHPTILLMSARLEAHRKHAFAIRRLGVSPARIT